MKNVPVVLSRPQAQALVALITDNLTTDELRPLDGVDRGLVAEAVALLMDGLTESRPVVRWHAFTDEHGPGWSLRCDLVPIAVARKQYRGEGVRCILTAGPEPVRLGIYPTLREARAVALAEFASRARHAAAS